MTLALLRMLPAQRLLQYVLPSSQPLSLFYYSVHTLRKVPGEAAPITHRC